MARRGQHHRFPSPSPWQYENQHYSVNDEDEDEDENDIVMDEIGRCFCARHERSVCHECCFDFEDINEEREVEAGWRKRNFPSQKQHRKPAQTQNYSAATAAAASRSSDNADRWFPFSQPQRQQHHAQTQATRHHRQRRFWEDDDDDDGGDQERMRGYQEQQSAEILELIEHRAAILTGIRFLQSTAAASAALAPAYPHSQGLDVDDALQEHYDLLSEIEEKMNRLVIRVPEDDYLNSRSTRHYQSSGLPDVEEIEAATRHPSSQQNSKPKHSKHTAQQKKKSGNFQSQQPKVKRIPQQTMNPRPDERASGPRIAYCSGISVVEPISDTSSINHGQQKKMSEKSQLQQPKVTRIPQRALNPQHNELASGPRIAYCNAVSVVEPIFDPSNATHAQQKKSSEKCQSQQPKVTPTAPQDALNPQHNPLASGPRIAYCNAVSVVQPIFDPSNVKDKKKERQKQREIEKKALLQAWAKQNPDDKFHMMTFGGTPESQKLFDTFVGKPPSAAAMDHGAEKFTCSYCGRNSPTKLMLCSQCQITSYCNRDCQKAAWKAHKKICKPLEKSTSQVTVTAAAAQQEPMKNTGSNDIGSRDSISAATASSTSNFSKKKQAPKTLPLTWEQVEVHGAGVPVNGRTLEVRAILDESLPSRQVFLCKDRVGVIRRIVVYTSSGMIPGLQQGCVLKWKNPRLEYFSDGTSGACLQDADLQHLKIIEPVD